MPNLRYFTTVARAAKVALSQAARLAEMKIEEFKALNPAYNYEVVNHSGSDSPPLGAKTFADVFGFDTPRLAAGLFIPAYNYEVVNASAILPLVVPVDRAQGFEQRLDEFMQKEQAREKPRSAKPSRRANQRMWPVTRRLLVCTTWW